MVPSDELTAQLVVEGFTIRPYGFQKDVKQNETRDRDNA